MLENPSNLPGWVALAAVLVTQGLAFLQFLRHERSENRRGDQEHALTVEQTLRTRLDTIEQRLDSGRETIIGLQGQVAALQGQLTTALAENERLKATNQEQRREYDARQMMSDGLIAEMRAELDLAHRQRDELREQVEELQRRVPMGPAPGEGGL